jgi:N-acetyl-alpha-D-muramate 1-phosphate uridylyltransferase
MKGMILTAGVGSRLKPLTDNTPKALVKVGEWTMLDLAIAYLKKNGVDEIIINVHHLADQLMEYVAEKKWLGYNIKISDETDNLLNTGGGLKKAAHFFSGEKDFVLMAVDILTNLDLTAMINQHQESGALVTLAAKNRTTSRDLLFDNEGNLAGWKHNTTGEIKRVDGRVYTKGFGFSGVHVINTKIFRLISETGPFSIVDMYLRLAENNDIKLFEHSNDLWLEFGRAGQIKELIESNDFTNLISSLNL